MKYYWTILFVTHAVLTGGITIYLISLDVPTAAIFGFLSGVTTALALIAGVEGD